MCDEDLTRAGRAPTGLEPINGHGRFDRGRRAVKDLLCRPLLLEERLVRGGTRRLAILESLLLGLGLGLVGRDFVSSLPIAWLAWFRGALAWWQCLRSLLCSARRAPAMEETLDSMSSVNGVLRLSGVDCAAQRRTEARFPD